ncbi:MAG: hypothetical protein LBK41_08070 [Clostridiales bacterium]|jgi:hypothetical protein|nr:hypothetical protein [Clostridiales bacterium]
MTWLGEQLTASGIELDNGFDVDGGIDGKELVTSVLYGGVPFGFYYLLTVALSLERISCDRILRDRILRDRILRGSKHFRVNQAKMRCKILSRYNAMRNSITHCFEKSFLPIRRRLVLPRLARTEPAAKEQQQEKIVVVQPALPEQEVQQQRVAC